MCRDSDFIEFIPLVTRVYGGFPGKKFIDFKIKNDTSH